MFEQIIYEHIKTTFTNASVYFGEAPSDAKAPYVVQHSLNGNGDAQVLCNSNDFEDGESFIQWTIYNSSPQYAFKLKNELMSLIGQLTKITLLTDTYMIQLNKSESSPSGKDANNGLFAEAVSRSFTYYKK